MCLRKWKSTGVGAMEAGLSSQSMQKGTPPEGRVGGRKKSAGGLLWAGDRGWGALGVG